MYARREIPLDLSALAETQGGVVLHRQVIDHGLSREVLSRLVNGGSWQRLAHGLFFTLPTVPPWLAIAWGGILLGGAGSRLGAESSGFLHKLLVVPPEVIDVLVPRVRRVRVAGPWRFVRERPTSRSPTTIGAPPRLAVETTVLDLAAAGSVSDVVHLVTRAVQLRITTPSRLLACLDNRARHPYRRLLADFLADVAEGAESPLELGYLRNVERAHGLPRGRRQCQRVGQRYYSDVGYDAYRLLVELDGRLGHEGDGRFRDMERDNRFVLAAMATLRYGWYDIETRPCAVAAQVAEALTSRGWTGQLRPCRRCTPRD